MLAAINKNFACFRKILRTYLMDDPLAMSLSGHPQIRLV